MTEFSSVCRWCSLNLREPTHLICEKITKIFHWKRNTNLWKHVMWGVSANAWVIMNRLRGHSYPVISQRGPEGKGKGVCCGSHPPLTTQLLHPVLSRACPHPFPVQALGQGPVSLLFTWLCQELEGSLSLQNALHQTELLELAECLPHTGPTNKECVNSSRTNPCCPLHPATALHSLSFSSSSSLKPSFSWRPMCSPQRSAKTRIMTFKISELLHLNTSSLCGSGDIGICDSVIIYTSKEDDPHRIPIMLRWYNTHGYQIWQQNC